MATRKTRVSKVEDRPDGTKVYGPYPKKNNAGKPTDRKISVVYNPNKKSGSKTSTVHTAKVELNKKRVANGQRPIPKQKPGKGVQVAHKNGDRTSTSASNLRAESASKNIGDGNAARRKK
jgi:hypothetical protein